jgi:hypothetical protein
MIVPKTVSIGSQCHVPQCLATYQERTCEAYQAAGSVREGNRLPEVVIARESKDVDQLRGIVNVRHDC